MKLLPSCNEGFRRLAFVTALLVALAGVGWGVWENVQARSAQFEMCTIGYRANRDICLQAETGMQAGCRERSEMTLRDCLHRSASITRESFEVFGFFAAMGLMAAYLAALAVRTVGWVTQGFARP